MNTEPELNWRTMFLTRARILAMIIGTALYVCVRLAVPVLFQLDVPRGQALLAAVVLHCITGLVCGFIVLNTFELRKLNVRAARERDAARD